MKYKGKKISTLLLLELTAATFTLGGVQRQIKNPSSPKEIVSEESHHVPDEIITELTENLKQKDIELDEKYSGYISGITINYDHITIDLVDGEKIESTITVPEAGFTIVGHILREKYKNAQTIKIRNLDLEKFTIIDTKFEEELSNSDYDLIDAVYRQMEIMHNYPEIDIKKISVKDELKICRVQTKDPYEYERWHNNINFSNCKNIWFNGITITKTLLNQIKRDEDLDRLILDDCALSNSLKGNVIFQSKSLRMLEFIPSSSSKRNNETTSTCNLSYCPNMEVLIIGSNMPLETIEGIPKTIKVISFGKDYNDSRKKNSSFQEKEDMAQTPYSMENIDLNIAGGYNVYISDLSQLEGLEKLEVLDITALNRVTPENLLKTIKTLPKLKKIIGLEVNNAIMYSDELVEYCTEQGIEHPFTEKSKIIKAEISKIINQIITPDMTDGEKIEAITRFVLEHMEYTYEATNTGNLTDELLIETWGENLYYALFYGRGVCDGYEKLTHALLQEAGINSYALTSNYHIWELVELNGEFFVLDTTRLDEYLEENDMKFDDIEPGSIYYLNDLDFDYPDYHNDPHFLPEGAEKSKNIFESIVKAILERLGLVQKQDIKDLFKTPDVKPKKISSLRLLNVFTKSWNAKELPPFLEKMPCITRDD